MHKYINKLFDTKTRIRNSVNGRKYVRCHELKLLSYLCKYVLNSITLLHQNQLLILQYGQKEQIMQSNERATEYGVYDLGQAKKHNFVTWLSPG